MSQKAPGRGERKGRGADCATATTAVSWRRWPRKPFPARHDGVPSRRLGGLLVGRSTAKEIRPVAVGRVRGWICCRLSSSPLVDVDTDEI